MQLSTMWWKMTSSSASWLSTSLATYEMRMITTWGITSPLAYRIFTDWTAKTYDERYQLLSPNLDSDDRFPFEGLSARKPYDCR